MRKIIIVGFAVLSACGQSEHEGIFIKHGQNEYAVSDDTLVIKERIVTNNVGFNKIRNGQLKIRRFSNKTWRLNEPGTPVIVFESNGLKLGNSFYRKVK